MAAAFPRRMAHALLALLLLLPAACDAAASGGTAGAPMRPPATRTRSAAAHTPPASATPAAQAAEGAAPATRPSVPPPGLPPLVQPDARHPLTVLVVGDSLGMDLGYGLRAVIGGAAGVRLVLRAVGSSGLANRAYYDWEAALGRELAAVRPQLVVALFGGNDAVSFVQDGRLARFGSDLWRSLYGARVAALMREATRAGAHVVWVGLPVMAPGAILSNAAMQELNAVYRSQAAAHPGVLYVSTWELFQAPSGGYTRYLRDASGRLQDVRAPDGVHVATPAGNALLASAVVAALDRSEGLRLCPAPSPYWHWAQFDCPAPAPVRPAP